MMPGADGYEVCRTLKEDKHTSHIPIVLLTAKAETREKLEGLHTGADDYLVKPFNTQELEARIHNLIEQRKALRERFQADALGTPHQIDGAHTDKAFLKQVTETIDAHLTNPQFSVEMLAAEVGFSRAHMNRKLNALTGLSANKFILDYRLQLALAMLRNGEHNVSEIGYKAGFGSTSYFVKCFREKFGTPPGALLKK
jgi:AraC-like DNA-binding protein